MLIKGGKVLNKDFEIEEKDIYIENGIIADSGDSGECLDITGLTLIPGLIDIHIHGFVGQNFATTDIVGLNELSDRLLKKGVASVLPTISTRSHEKICEAIKNITETMEKGTVGADFLGINLEGPYLNIEKKGGMRYQDIRPFNEKEFEEYIALSKGNVKIMTIAPEIAENFKSIKLLQEKNVVPSIGHTAALAGEVRESIKEGIRHTTHLFNAMRGINHREPGVVGAVFDSDITAELICDGHHIDEAIVRMAYKLLGRERLILISDAVVLAGLPDGTYDFDGQMAIKKDGRCTLPDGTINGNINDLFECVRRAVRFGIPFCDAVYCASYMPAKRVGAQDRKGSIDIGKDADLVAVDSELNIKYIIKSGKIIDCKQ